MTRSSPLKIATASRVETLFERAHSAWQERVRATEATNQALYQENLKNFEDWQRRAAAYQDSCTNHNASIERARTSYQALDVDAILTYCDLVLSRSQYADCFPKEFELDYHAATKTIVVQYRLPAPDHLPRVKAVTFSEAKGDFSKTGFTKPEFERLYSDVVFQVALRTLHELFEADVVRALEVVIFNGDVRMLNVGTGYTEDQCILSVRAERPVFEGINLRNINPRACFDSLGGVAGANILDCNPVKPFASIDKSGERFAAAQDVPANGVVGLDGWHEVAKTISASQQVRFLRVGSLAALHDFPAQEKYSVALSKALAEVVTARGYAIEPDVRYGAAAYRGEEEIALFRPLETPVTAAYPGAAALLYLCVMIAAADEHPTEKELEIARDFIRRNATLTSQEQQRLFILEHYLCRNPDAAKRPLARIAKHLPPSQRQLIAEVLVCIAGANGVINSTEWQALDRAYKVLELPPSALDEILRKLGAQFDEPTVQEAQAAAAGEPIAEEVSTLPAPSFTLDMARVAAISHETVEVIGLLSAVMSEEEPRPAPSPQPAAPVSLSPDTPAWLSSLETKYRAIAARIVVKPSWPRAEFQQLAAEFKLMPLGVVDALNEWADANLGEFLLDGDDPVSVNTSILPK